MERGTLHAVARRKKKANSSKKAAENGPVRSGPTHKKTESITVRVFPRYPRPRPSPHLQDARKAAHKLLAFATTANAAATTSPAPVLVMSHSLAVPRHAADNPIRLGQKTRLVRKRRPLMLVPAADTSGRAPAHGGGGGGRRSEVVVVVAVPRRGRAPEM